MSSAWPGERSGARSPERGSGGGGGEGGKGEGARPHGSVLPTPAGLWLPLSGAQGLGAPAVAGLGRDSVRLSDRCPVLLPGPARPAQVVRDQMRQVQHRLQQERLRDARPRQGVPHRVLPLRGLQPPAHPRGRVRAARGRALLPRGPRRGGAGQPGRRRPAQPAAPGAPAADGRYAGLPGRPPGPRRRLRAGAGPGRPPARAHPRLPPATPVPPGRSLGRWPGAPRCGVRGHRVAWGGRVPCAPGPCPRRPHTCGAAHGRTGMHTRGTQVDTRPGSASVHLGLRAAASRNRPGSRRVLAPPLPKEGGGPRRPGLSSDPARAVGCLKSPGSSNPSAAPRAEAP